jgi:hypothetical protein
MSERLRTALGFIIIIVLMSLPFWAPTVLQALVEGE